MNNMINLCFIENQINNKDLFDDETKSLLYKNVYKQKELIDKMEELESNISLPTKDLMKYYLEHNVIKILCIFHLSVILYQYEKNNLIKYFNFFIDSLIHCKKQKKKK